MQKLNEEYRVCNDEIKREIREIITVYENVIIAKNQEKLWGFISF